MNAAALIAANVRAHTVHSSTSWHMVAAAHEATIRGLVARLNEFTGADATPSNGCEISEQSLGDATVLVEYSLQPAEGDGVSEPRTDASVSVSQVLINGVWCDVGEVVSPGTVERWEERIREDAAPIPCGEARLVSWGEWAAAVNDGMARFLGGEVQR